MSEPEPADTAAEDTAPAAATARAWRRPAARVLGLSLVLGVVVGIGWWLVAPTPALVVGDGGYFYRSSLPGEFVAMDGWFAVLTASAGAIVAVLVLRRREVSVATVLAMATGGLLGALTAWGVGRLLGPDRPEFRGDEAIGVIAYGPLTLTARGVLLVWPILALAIVLFTLAWQGPERDAPAPAARVPESPDEPEGTGRSVRRDRQVGDLDGGQ